jgi:ABC-type Fe3+-hydroxamate transport system substrate-binding protein
MSITLQDDFGRQIFFHAAPKRVVSLVPSDTLSLCDLGCEGALIGRSDYCELPAAMALRVPAVGGTKNPRIKDILALNADLILVNQEENSRADVAALIAAKQRVYIAFPKRVTEGLAHLARLARIFHLSEDTQTKQLLKQGYEALRVAEAARSSMVPMRTFCPIWAEPLMTIHGATYLSDMLDLVGAQNVFADRERRYPLAADLGLRSPITGAKVEGKDVRYPRVTIEEVLARNPELLVLPSEPHPFSEAEAASFRLLDIPANRTNNVHFVDGKDLSWSGSRAITGIARLQSQFEQFRTLAAGALPPR